MTKKFTRNLALSTALLGMMAGGALAAEPTTDELLYAALFGVSVGAHDASDNGDDGTDLDDGAAFTISGDAAVNIPLGVMFSAQLDVQSEFYDRGNENEDDAIGASMIGGHLSYRDPNIWLLGLFAGVGAGNSTDLDSGMEIGYLGGAEAQFYLGNITLYGQIGYADFMLEPDSPPDEFTGFFGGVEARYFIHDDMLVSANVAYGESDHYDESDSGDAWNWGVGGKMRVSDSMPIYGTLNYRGGQYREDDDKITEHAVLLGLSFGFGANSLMENDRRGATLNTPMLPARAAAWQQALE